MRFIASILLIVSLLCAAVVSADEVQVFLPASEELSDMQMRANAQAACFAEAALREADKMLSAPLAPERREALRAYYMEKAGDFVLSFKVVSTTPSEEGLSMDMDVVMNRTPLRHDLGRLGLLRHAAEPVAANVVLVEPFSEDANATLAHSMLLTNVVQDDNAPVNVRLAYGKTKVWRGSIDGGESFGFSGSAKTLSDLWFDLWAKYFAKQANDAPVADGTIVSVSGWFNPDGVMDFDRVFRRWDDAVQDVELLDMNMVASGVSAAWRVRVTNRGLLDSRMEGYLPERGLKFSIKSEAEQD